MFFGIVRTLPVVGAFTHLGAQRPVAPPTRRGPCFLYKKAGGKNRRAPPCTRSLKPLAGARSIFWVGGLWNGLFLARVHQTRFGNAYSEKQLLTGSCSAKIQPKKISQKKVPKSGHVGESRKSRSIPLLRLYPKRWSERAASGLETGVQGQSPWCSFLHFSHEKWRPPAGIPPGRCAPRLVKAPTTHRVRTAGAPPGPTLQPPGRRQTATKNPQTRKGLGERLWGHWAQSKPRPR